MKKIILINLFLLVTLAGATSLDKKEQLLQYTKPMVNIFESYEKHAGIDIQDLIIEENRIEFVEKDSTMSYSFEKKMGANFSIYPRITRCLNIYTKDDEVFYIEALKFSDLFAVEFGVGSHFMKNSYCYAIEVGIIHQVNENFEVGLKLSDFTTFRQTNISLFCEYKHFKIVSVTGGVHLHKQWKARILSKDFNFPQDDEKYELKDELYSSFFFNPGIEFTSGKFTLRQGLEVDFILLYGESFGIARQLKAVLQLDYQIF